MGRNAIFAESFEVAAVMKADLEDWLLVLVTFELRKFARAVEDR